MANNEDKKLILLVDDEPTNTQVEREILKKTFRTRVAKSAAKALELVKVVPPPDMILLDIMTPEMTDMKYARS